VGNRGLVHCQVLHLGKYHPYHFPYHIHMAHPLIIPVMASRVLASHLSTCLFGQALILILSNKHRYMYL
jgi:hypothetical protein